MDSFLTMTNAVKAGIIAVVNALLNVLLAFGVSISDAQQSAILILVNAVLALWVLLTYAYSHKRREDV
jgi:hypothetical protein